MKLVCLQVLLIYGVWVNISLAETSTLNIGLEGYILEKKKRSSGWKKYVLYAIKYVAYCAIGFLLMK